MTERTVIGKQRRAVLPLLVLVCLSLGGCSGVLTGFGVGMPKELQRNGVSAQGRILEIWDTGWTINDNPVIGMKVQVEPADRPAFEATIQKTAISRIAVPRFQPGNFIPVRFDPGNPTVVAVDFEGSVRSEPASGNPYRDRFLRSSSLGAVFLPPPDSPQLYLGTADRLADTLALYENEYLPLGASSVVNGSNPQQALDQGKLVGAALVVVYGQFDPQPGLRLDVLPLRRRPLDPGQPAASVPALAGGASLGSGPGPNEQLAAYWGKTRRAILGIVSRPLEEKDRAQLGRKDGIVVSGVANGSPAAAAHILAGDVIVAINGKPLVDPLAMPAIVSSLAGQQVRLDMVRGGSPLSTTVQLNPAEP